MQYSLCLGEYSYFQDGEKMTDVRTLLADLTLLQWELLKAEGWDGCLTCLSSERGSDGKDLHSVRALPSNAQR